MNPPRLVRRCACPGCPRLTLWPACALHRVPEMTTAMQARGLHRLIAPHLRRQVIGVHLAGEGNRHETE